MVRLKAPGRYKNSRPTRISIPYGAIKSKFTKPVFNTVIKFQFLMVRLKVVIGGTNLQVFLNFNSLWCD